MVAEREQGFPKIESEEVDSLKIGFYGGTFNPIHNGHLAVAKAVLEKMGLDEVVFIPSARPPHKDNSVIDAEIRLRMVELSIASKPRFSVSEIEIRREGKSYTLLTIEELKRIYPDDQIFWIIGADSLIEMPTVWRGGWGLLDLVRFVVIKRPGYDLSEVPAEILKKVAVIEMEILISSTIIRELADEGTSIESFVAEKVARFIEDRGLYRRRET